METNMLEAGPSSTLPPVFLPSVRWPAPRDELMTACDVLSWIAFGEVRELDARIDRAEVYRWGSTDLNRTLAAIHAIIAGTWDSARKAEVVSAPGAIIRFNPGSGDFVVADDSELLGSPHAPHPAWGEDGRAWIEALQVRVEQQDRVAVSLPKLGEMLAEHIEWHHQACALLYRAEHELLEALRGGKLTAYGRRNGAGEYQAIPVTVFMDARVGVNWFNTVEGEHLGPRYTNVQFQRDDVLDLWPEQQSEPSAMMEPQQAQSSEITEPQQPEPLEAVAPATVSRPKHPGGRPPKYDWAAFDREMMRLANTPDGLPVRTTLFGHMAQWCTNIWGDAPADSKIRDRIAKRYPEG
jgi:hypothetical protein